MAFMIRNLRSVTLHLHDPKQELGDEIPEYYQTACGVKISWPEFDDMGLEQINCIRCQKSSVFWQVKKEEEEYRLRTKEKEKSELPKEDTRLNSEIERLISALQELTPEQRAYFTQKIEAQREENIHRAEIARWTKAVKSRNPSLDE